MACATCKGMRQVKGLAPPSFRPLNAGVSKEPNWVWEPCPDCTPKPFARVVPVEDDLIRDAHTVEVCGHQLRTRSAGGLERHEGRLARIAQEINGAVEAREAKLRGPLQLAVEALDTAHRLHASGVFGDRATIDALADAIRAGSAALGPNPPDYVPAAELRAAEEKLRQLTAAFDVLESRGLDATGRVVREFLVASGLKEPSDPPMRLPAGVRLDSAALAQPQLTTPLGALMERLRSLGIIFDAHRLDRDRAYYEAAQQACNAAVPPPEVLVWPHP